MKTKNKYSKLFFSVISLLTFSFALAQEEYHYKKVWKWEGITKNHQIVFGVAPTKYQAQLVIDDFNERNSQTNYFIVHLKIKSIIVKYTGDENYFDTFQKQFPKKYIVLSMDKQNAITLFQKEGFHSACTYYSKTRNISYPVAQKYLEKLFSKHCIYKLNFKPIKKHHWI